jgi:crotonobetainyl-CoA:carnitine CoA-transferase CaiB-like acyl-CoA transferase
MSSKPLSGLTVVDLSRLLPGPLAARLLADLGARVVKVEEPRTGDMVRHAPPRVAGESALAHLLLAGVESVALDLKSPTARDLLLDLLGRADVLLDTFRPGTLKRLGLDPEELQERFPELVICSLTGWGEDGPYARRAGHDVTYQAVAGSLAPTASMPAVPVADVVGAWSAVASILAALVEKQRTGRGSRIDASLFDAAVHANLTAWASEAGGPREVGEALPLTGALPCYGLYRARDGGYLAVGALEPHFWRRFCEVVGRPDLLRIQLRDDEASRAEVARLVGERTREEWRRLLSTHDLPIEPVLSAAEALAHPQTQARDLLSFSPEGRPRLAYPARLDGERPGRGGDLPELGESTEPLVEELGGEASTLSRRARRRRGVGRRFSLRRLFLGWWLR